jgi:O-methyltransferase/methyltransferase family protein
MTELRRLITGFRVSQAIHVAAVLGISDLLADGPLDVAELARRTGSHERSLYRLLRALATAGVYRELDAQRFESTPLGDELRTDAPASAAGQAAFIGTEAAWRAWAGLLHSVRTGENAFRAVHGQGVWEYRVQHPEDGAAFDESMISISRGIAEATLDAYDFGRFGRLVDVGGGRGGFLSAILARYPTVQGVLFDQAHVLAGAPSTLDTVAGSFFDEVPAGADAYVLKSIIHDWPDEESVAILRVVGRAMRPDSTLLLVERVMPGPNEGFDAAFSDLNMLVSPGGQERTEPEYTALLEAAGFTLTRVIPTRGEFSLIEGRTASASGLSGPAAGTP